MSVLHGWMLVDQGCGGSGQNWNISIVGFSFILFVCNGYTTVQRVYRFRDLHVFCLEFREFVFFWLSHNQQFSHLQKNHLPSQPLLPLMMLLQGCLYPCHPPSFRWTMQSVTQGHDGCDTEDNDTALWGAMRHSRFLSIQVTHNGQKIAILAHDVFEIWSSIFALVFCSAQGAITCDVNWMGNWKCMFSWCHEAWVDLDLKQNYFFPWCVHFFGLPVWADSQWQHHKSLSSLVTAWLGSLCAGNLNQVSRRQLWRDMAQ